MQALADVEDAATEAAFQAAQASDQAPPVTKAQPPVIQEPPAVPIPLDDSPTEPATSPRHADPAVHEWAVELQLPTREYGPCPEPERCATRFVLNDGQWTPEEHEQVLRKASQAINAKYWNREAREEAERANRECAQSMADWRARVDALGLKAHPAAPQGPPPKGVRLQLHSLHFLRKPLQQQAEVRQLGSTQRTSLQGLVPNRSNQHHLRSFQDLLQPLQHIHLVRLCQPFLNQLKSLRIQRH